MKLSTFVFTLFCFASLHSSPLHASTATTHSSIPRTVVTLYDSSVDPDIWFTRMHQYAEMPLNHLGVKLDYYDIRKGLPDLNKRDDVIGVLVWFPKYTELPEAQKYLEWAIETIDSEKKFVIMGTPGFYLEENPVPLHIINAFWNRLGLEDVDDWVSDTYEVEFSQLDPKVVEFERKYKDVKPPYFIINVVDERVRAHVLARQYSDASTDSVLVATGPNGGYAYEGYERYEIFNENEDFRQWYINPFEFFRLAFDLTELPKPDTTTLAGRRIYYSHVDGDGWNNVTELERYRQSRSISAEVIYREVILRYPDMPVTVAPIAAEIDLDWEGTNKSQEVAKKIFAESNVEVGSHTYSHPLEWRFFKNYTPEKEYSYLSKYRYGSWKGNPLWTKLKSFWLKWNAVSGKDSDPEQLVDDSAYVLQELTGEYDIPRAYANMPFDLHHEVQGSIDIIQKLCPAGKKVMLFQWSGNCLPFDEAVQHTKKARIRNFNGGDSRYDAEFLSYSWVRPLGRQCGDMWQIYTSASNETKYTNKWRERFYGFSLLAETLENTEMPIRLKPINVYYHMYSGEKLASLNALIQNLEYVRAQEIIPVTTSHFAGIVEGFYTTKIIPLGNLSWKFQDRGELQTMRFDRCALSVVDFSRSEGVVGQRHLQGSLYVYLDQSHSEPIVALRQTTSLFEERPKGGSYLVESSWRIWNLQRENSDHFRFETQGYGKGTMRWKVPNDGVYRISWKDSGVREVQAKNNELQLALDLAAFHPLEIEVKLIGEIVE